MSAVSGRSWSGERKSERKTTVQPLRSSCCQSSSLLDRSSKGKRSLAECRQVTCTYCFSGYAGIFRPYSNTNEGPEGLNLLIQGKVRRAALEDSPWPT